MATKQVTDYTQFRNAIQDVVIVVEVGPERVKHFVRKTVLEEHSEYFKRALNGSWKEADDKVVCLDDVDCSTFGVFSYWLYTGKLPITTADWNDEEYRKDFDAKSKVRWHTTTQLKILKAYNFADRMLSPKLRKALEYRLIDHFITGGRLVYYETVIYSFAHLPPTSPILRAIVDTHCRFFNEKRDTEENGELGLHAQLPNAFLICVMKRFAQIHADDVEELERYWSSYRPLKFDRCDYHDHAKKSERKDCRRAAGLPVYDDSGSDSGDLF